MAAGATAPVPRRAIEATLEDLIVCSESRGREASGLAVLDADEIRVLKCAVAGSDMIRTPQYAETVRARGGNGRPAGPLTLIGHSRLVTTGSQHDSRNNQPVIAGRAVGIHNGIVVNHDELWRRYPSLTRHYEVDTEVIFALLRLFYEETGDIAAAVRRVFAEIKGAASIAILFEELDILLLATNNGSLYRCGSPERGAFLFASERHIVERVAGRPRLRKYLSGAAVDHIAAGNACVVNMRDLSIHEFPLTNGRANGSPAAIAASPRRIVELAGIGKSQKPLNAAQRAVGLAPAADDATREYLDAIRRKFPHDSSWQDSLRRCTRCILPETMPFIEFDADGVCNYCRNYRKIEILGADRLEEQLAPHRSASSAPDCVVGVSGGRDSLYTLHYLKNEMNMNPVAYTYDWGMVTDLARRNISRICGKLGIEHVLVSADIGRKRSFIRKNVTAWLRRPHLGMIPLFMAGDKQYFYYLQKVRRQTGARLNVLGENMLERTDFKTGFAGVRPHNADPRHVYTLSPAKKIALTAFYGREYFVNPGYINASLFDTAFAAVCYYVIDRSFINLYNYIPWEEEVIVPTLLNEYEFERSPDTETTWRIGDGTAAFYNYIYYTVAGFTENDTFRSNQIREGYLTRDEALARVRVENRPRYESIHWYLGIIDLELGMDEVLSIIHNIPRIRPA